MFYDVVGIVFEGYAAILYALFHLLHLYGLFGVGDGIDGREKFVYALHRSQPSLYGIHPFR